MALAMARIGFLVFLLTSLLSVSPLLAIRSFPNQETSHNTDGEGIVPLDGGDDDVASSLLLMVSDDASEVEEVVDEVTGLLVSEEEEGVEWSLPRFAEAPEYRNAPECKVSDYLRSSSYVSACDPSHVHIAMTLDAEYIRGSMAAVLSVLKHASCPENVFFHFVTNSDDSTQSTESTLPSRLNKLFRSTFPSLNFKMYLFDQDRVKDLISSSIREALENPLNYARNYLGDILEICVDRVIYLDSDLLVVDDIAKLWGVVLKENRIIGAPEYCHANFSVYFTDQFWSDPVLSSVFLDQEKLDRERRRACYFNTGVMVMDLKKFRVRQCRQKIERWMEVQKLEKRIYELGSLPPFLLEFGGRVEPIEHRWNQHGLGGDNVKGSCRRLHPGPVSLLHWSGKGKPWSRLDDKRACPIDHLWVPYDLYLRSSTLDG